MTTTIRPTLLMILACAGIISAAQDLPAAFDAAVIRRSPPGPYTPGVRSLPDGVMIATNRPLITFLAFAWPDHTEVSGTPEWLSRELYDVTVKPRPGATPEQTQEMWRTLFLDRLKLRLHFEPREVPAFALVAARRDRRLGPALQRSTLNCDDAALRKAPQSDARGYLDAAMRSCELRFGYEYEIGRMVSGGTTLEQIALRLGRSVLGRPVRDDTGLQGWYAVDLRYSTLGADLAPAGNGSDIHAALREQLGLKVEPTIATIEVLVIDRVERPSESDN